MLDKLKADFDGILELVQKAPVPLQETALRTILEQWFATNGGAVPPPPPIPNSPAPGTPAAAQVPANVRAVMVANALTEAELEKVMHPLGPNAQLTVSEIPGTG